MASTYPVRLLGAALIFCLLPQPPALAATIPVFGTCALADAILAANTDSLQGGCLAGSGPDTLELMASAAGITASLPTITSDITIDGNGRVILAGTMPMSEPLFVVGFTGKLVIRDIFLLGNDQASNAAFSSGTLEIAYSSLSDFTSEAVKIDGGTAQLNDLAVSSSGSGVSILSGSATITYATISEHSGNGIVVAGGSLDLSNSTVSDNGQTGLDVTPPCTGTVTVTNSTLSSNGDVSFPGSGGLRAGCPGVSLVSSTVARNKAQAPFGSNVEVGPLGELSVENSLIGVKTGAVSCTVEAGGTLTPGGSQADDTSCGSIPDTLTGLATTLEDNGGPTWTHALNAPSSAIDALGACGLATDQRGVPRVDGQCDAGAYEVGPCPVLEIANRTFLGGASFDDCKIVVGPNVTVDLFGSLTLTAGDMIEVQNGFSVESSTSAVVFEIDPNLLVTIALEAAGLR